MNSILMLQFDLSGSYIILMSDFSFFVLFCLVWSKLVDLHWLTPQVSFHMILTFKGAKEAVALKVTNLLWELWKINVKIHLCCAIFW